MINTGAYDSCPYEGGSWFSPWSPSEQSEKTDIISTQKLHPNSVDLSWYRYILFVKPCYF